MPQPYYQDEYVTLYHGDCLELADAWVGADVLVTDPPYGMAYQSGRVPTRIDRPIAGDQNTNLRDQALELWGGIAPPLHSASGINRDQKQHVNALSGRKPQTPEWATSPARGATRTRKSMYSARASSESAGLTC